MRRYAHEQTQIPLMEPEISRHQRHSVSSPFDTLCVVQRSTGCVHDAERAATVRVTPIRIRQALINASFTGEMNQLFSRGSIETERSWSYRSVMRHILLWLGIGLIVLTLAAWYLLSGFGCEMNTSGCKTVRLDWSRDALVIFLPPLATGLALVMIGVRQKRRYRAHDE